MDLGIESVAYLNTGSRNSPSWQPITCIENLTVSKTKDKVDANSRASRTKKYAYTMVEVTVTGRLKNKPDDIGYEAIMDAFDLDAAIDLLILNGEKEDAGVRGVRADFGVSSASEDQGLGARLYTDITLDVMDTDNPAQFVQVSGTGVLTYAEFGATAFA